MSKKRGPFYWLGIGLLGLVAWFAFQQAIAEHNGSAETERQASAQQRADKTEAAVAARQVFEGMSSEAVRRSWGEPVRIVSSTDGRQTWWYAGGVIEIRGDRVTKATAVK